MTASVERFRLQSPTQAQLQSQIAPGVTVTPAAVSPYLYLDLSLSDSSAKDDLAGGLRLIGYEWVESDPPVAAALTGYQQITAVLSGAISESADLWETVVETPTSPMPGAFKSKGGTKARVEFDLSYSCTVGGVVQLIVNGGAFTDYVLREAQLDTGTNKTIRKLVVFQVPVTPSYTEYVFTLRFMNEGLVSSVSCDTSNARHNATLVVGEFK